MTSTLAVSLTPLETRREVIVHLAVRAEELGYDAVFLAEAWGHDVSVLLAEVALRTSRIQIGTGVVNVWGRSAAGIAMLAASLAEVSGGRFVLGLGSGTPQLAEGLHGVPFRAPVQRLGRVAREVRDLLGGGRAAASVPGGSRPLRLAVRPPSEVPIQLAALGPEAIRLCGEVADRWLPFLLPRSGMKRGIAALEEAAGPGRVVPLVCPGVPVSVSPDRDRARAGAAWWIVHYLTSMGPLYARTLREHGLGEAVDEVLAANPARGSAEVPFAAQVLLDELTVYGDAAQARAGLERWYGAGADMPAVVLTPNAPVEDLERTLEAFRPA
jgi:alkanesulfonate monooxygenase SsuD/methylene tetrahydromethanopterin reductase-like flavin-dependent oxidoreductase (luciferase family)